MLRDRPESHIVHERQLENERIAEGERVELAEVTLDEELLLVRHAQDDRRAFGVLYDRYVDRVYRYAYRRSTNHADAEDVTAETFRRALEALERYEARGLAFGNWLLGIAANVIRERSRVRASTSSHELPDGLPVDGEPADQDPAAIDVLVQQEEASALWRLVDDLPLDLRRALILRYAWDLSYGDIAKRLGRSDSACKQLVYRALKALRARAEDIDAEIVRRIQCSAR
jgi:RNA polymerase sigma-70 factor (ECF subfamily)